MKKALFNMLLHRFTHKLLTPENLAPLPEGTKGIFYSLKEVAAVFNEGFVLQYFPDEQMLVMYDISYDEKGIEHKANKGIFQAVRGGIYFSTVRYGEQIVRLFNFPWQ